MGQPYLRIEPDQGCSINRQLDDTRASKQYDKRRQFRSSLVLTHTLLLLLLTPTEAKEIGIRGTESGIERSRNVRNLDDGDASIWDSKSFVATFVLLILSLVGHALLVYLLWRKHRECTKYRLTKERARERGSNANSHSSTNGHFQHNNDLVVENSDMRLDTIVSLDNPLKTSLAQASKSNGPTGVAPANMERSRSLSHSSVDIDSERRNRTSKMKYEAGTGRDRSNSSRRVLKVPLSRQGSSGSKDSTENRNGQTVRKARVRSPSGKDTVVHIPKTKPPPPS